MFINGCMYLLSEVIAVSPLHGRVYTITVSLCVCLFDVWV